MGRLTSIVSEPNKFEYVEININTIWSWMQWYVDHALRLITMTTTDDFLCEIQANDI